MKKMQSIEGSVSIEAAFIIPMIMGVFIFFLTMMQVVYTHGKVQVALNEVCKDLTYDSYIFNELGILQLNQALYAKGLDQSITVEDLTLLKEQLTQIVPEVGMQLRDVTFESSLKNVKMDTINQMIEDKTKIIDVMVNMYGMITEFSQSIGTESGYFINTMLLRVYVNEKMQTYLEDSRIDYSLKHVSGFLEDDSGQIVLSTEHIVPILFMRKKITLNNGGYFHAFTGFGKFSASYNKVIKTSQYGQKDANDSEEEDQDGFSKKVYVTEHGSRYHQNKNCFHIRVDVNRIRLRDISGKRLCEYCGDSSVELADYTVVYTTKNSRVFHTDSRCHSIYHHITTYSEKEAIAKGYGPCKTCSHK